MLILISSKNFILVSNRLVNNWDITFRNEYSFRKTSQFFIRPGYLGHVTDLVN